MADIVCIQISAVKVNALIDQFHVDVTVTSLAAARALWWQKRTVTRGVKREKST